MSAALELTEKQRNFCHAYIETGDAFEAYTRAYDTKGGGAARTESYKLMRNPKIQDYLLELQKPIRAKSFRDRDRKRERLWKIIDDPEASNADVCRAMDVLNKLDGEYIAGGQRMDEDSTDISNLDLETLRQIVN